MEFITAAYTDIGIKKRTNQDSLMIETAETDYGKVCFAVVCDGMGGLEKGEVASATLIRAFKEWFRETFPQMLYEGIIPEQLKSSWENLIFAQNGKITNYGLENNVKLGTTCVALLIVDGVYYTVNIGDSRIYEISDKLKKLTKDQTFIQREMDAGRMTEEEAVKSSRRNVLLQCVGASNIIEPVFKFGEVKERAIYMLCSDGFRHVITEEEILTYLDPAKLTDEEKMNEGMIYLTELNKYRREDDNISVAVIKVVKDKTEQ